MKNWDEDLFERRQTAQNLIAYCESVSKAGALLDEERSLVIAVDAEYGLGKTYFLKGLMLDACEKHPVAYIDAWADDLIDEPLIALAAVLKTAVRPLIEADPKLKSRWGVFARKTGKVFWLGSKGLAKRGAQLAITSGAVDQIADVLEIDDAALRKEIAQAANDAVTDTVKDVEDELKALEENEVLSAEIERFEAGRQAIEDMKRSLSALVSAIEAQGKSLPVFIIIDELDRCRPSYAIKLLEELKHLFSVPGVVFVLGVNSTQLSRAIAGVYGSQFSGSSYLERFIDRSISLPFPPLRQLTGKMLEKIPGFARLKFPKVTAADSRNEIPPIEVVTWILEFYKISPRNIFKFFDRLQTCLAISKEGDVDGIYLLELIARSFATNEIENGRPWQVGVGGGFNNWQWLDGDLFFAELHGVYSLTQREARKVAQDDSPISEHQAWFLDQSGSYGSPVTYRALLNAVGAIGG